MLCHKLVVAAGWSPASLQLSSPQLSRLRTLFFLVVMSSISFTAEEIASTPKLETSLDGLLFSAKVKPQIIFAFRVQEITSIEDYVIVTQPRGFTTSCLQLEPQKGFTGTLAQVESTSSSSEEGQ